MRVYSRSGGSGCLPDLPSSGLTRPPEVRRLKTARKNRPKYGLYTVRFKSRPIRRATRSNYGRIYTSLLPDVYIAPATLSSLYMAVYKVHVPCHWVQHEFTVCSVTLLTATVTTWFFCTAILRNHHWPRKREIFCSLNVKFSDHFTDYSIVELFCIIST